MLKGHFPPPPSYRALFEAALADLPGAGDPLTGEARRKAFTRFETAGIPGAKAEAWKYTPAASLLPRELTTGAGAPEIAPDRLRPYLIAERSARVVFVDGTYAGALSDMPSAENGVRVRRLADALADGEEAILDRVMEDVDGRSFDALNGALVQDGCMVHFSAGMKTAAPVEIVHVLNGTSSEASTLSNLCHIIDLGEGAVGHVVETTICLDGTTAVANVRNRCSLASTARFVHERMQVGSTSGTLLARSTYDLSADSRLTQNVVTVGGRLVRNEIGARLGGSAIEALFNGLFAIGTGQHVDNALQIRHAAPGSMSDQAYRGVLDGRAKAAFAGQIVVERPAQQTNAYQSNNNLLLSPEAEINTKPELEIFADDVKCSHGATVGEIDEHELFYLRARGLDAESARTMLTFAFAGEVLERLVDASVARIARREMLAKLPGGEALQELLS